MSDSKEAKTEKPSTHAQKKKNEKKPSTSMTQVTKENFAFTLREAKRNPRSVSDANFVIAVNFAGDVCADAMKKRSLNMMTRKQAEILRLCSSLITTRMIAIEQASKFRAYRTRFSPNVLDKIQDCFFVNPNARNTSSAIRQLLNFCMLQSETVFVDDVSALLRYVHQLNTTNASMVAAVYSKNSNDKQGVVSLMPYQNGNLNHPVIYLDRTRPLFTTKNRELLVDDDTRACLSLCYDQKTHDFKPMMSLRMEIEWFWFCPRVSTEYRDDVIECSQELCTELVPLLLRFLKTRGEPEHQAIEDYISGTFDNAELRVAWAGFASWFCRVNLMPIAHSVQFHHTMTICMRDPTGKRQDMFPSFTLCDFSSTSNDRIQEFNAVYRFPFDNRGSKHLRNSECATCHRRAYTLCGRCRMIYYCCKQCQITDWRRHRRQCKRSQKKQ